MVTTSLQGGTPENPVGGTLVTQICQMTGTEVTVVKQGNPSWYGGSASGPVTETSHSGSITVNSYDDCPNREPDEPATMIFESTLSTEYTKLNMRSDTFQNAWSFKGVGYYRQQTVTAELLIDKHEETISFQKTKYKVRIPPDLPRPYTINWLEVFTPEDENPDDLIEPQITVKAKSAVIQGAESQEFTIDPSTTPDKEGSWSLLPVEIIPNPLPLDGVARMKIDLGSNNFADLPEENMPKITIGGEICDEVVQDKETLSIFYFTPPSKSEADVFDLVISGITVPNYPYLSNGKPLKLLKIVSYTDDLDQGTEGIFNSILVSIDEAKSRALRPIQEEQSFTVSVVDRFMNRMTHVANTGTGMAKEFYSDKSIGVSIEAKINSLVSKCNARNEKVILELDDGGVIAVATATARASAAAAGPVFGSKTFFSDVKTLLLTNGKKIYQGIYGSARFAVINADDFDYTAWTATIANQNIFSAVAKNPDAKIIINGALFNYKSEPNVTTGMVYSNGLKLATSVGPSHKGYKTAELRYWFGQNVDNTPAANGGKAASFKFGGKGHPPVPATPGATDLHSATGGLLSLIWPDATGVRQKVTVAMDMDLKIYTGFTGPMYGHGIIGVDRHTGMLIILSKENGKTEYLDIFDVRDKLWDSGVEQAAVTDGGSSVCFWVEGAIKVKGARHYGKSSMNDTVTNYMIFSIR